MSQPAADIGGIVTVNYLNGGDGKSPLIHNAGLPSFEWVGDLFVNVRVSEEISTLFELETVRGWNVQLYGGSIIYKIFADRLKVEAGKFVAPFGNFLSRRFAPQNFLYGFPVYYEYRTGLATNDVPENNQELLRARGTGQGDYTYSNATAGAALLQNGQLREFANLQATAPTQPATGHIVTGSDGVKILAKETYISGVQFFGAFNRFSYSVGLANGALSNPTDLSVSRRPMVFGRLHWQPLIGLDLGLSAASGSYLNHQLVHSQHPELRPEKYVQNIAGVDLGYSRGYLVFFGEGAFSRWQSPFIHAPLDALAFSAEWRYKITPRVFLAVRYSRISFSKIADPLDVDADGALSEPWEFPVWRAESALGYYLSRHALLKTVWQVNRTGDQYLRGGKDPADDLVAVQMTVFY